MMTKADDSGESKSVPNQEIMKRKHCQGLSDIYAGQIVVIYEAVGDYINFCFNFFLDPTFGPTLECTGCKDQIYGG